MEAVTIFECPQKPCDFQDSQEGSCPDHGIDLQEARPKARPRYAVSFPWSQIVDVCDGLEIGLATPAFRDRVDVQTYEFLSRRHARIFWGSDNKLYIEDLWSTNGTLVDGKRLKPGEPKCIGPERNLSLSRSVPIELLELNEYGEPIPSGKGHHP